MTKRCVSCEVGLENEHVLCKAGKWWQARTILPRNSPSSRSRQYLQRDILKLPHARVKGDSPDEKVHVENEVE